MNEERLQQFYLDALRSMMAILGTEIAAEMPPGRRSFHEMADTWHDVERYFADVCATRDALEDCRARDAEARADRRHREFMDWLEARR